MDIDYNFNTEESLLLDRLKDYKFIFIIDQGGTATRFVANLIRNMGIYIGHGNTINKQNDSLLFNKYYENKKIYK